MITIKTSFVLLGIFLSATMFAQNGIILKGDGLDKLSVSLGTWHLKIALHSTITSAVYTCRWSVNRNFLVYNGINRIASLEGTSAKIKNE